METVYFDKYKLITEVQEILSHWQKEKPETRTIAHLARETGVSESSIRRLQNGGVKIADDSIYKLLSFISGEYKYKEFLSYFGQRIEVQNWFTRNYAFMAHSASIQEYKPSPVSSVIATNPIMFSVYMLISSVENMTAKGIMEQFGLRGEIELENLLSKGLVILDGSSLKVKDKNIKITKDETISLLPDLTKMYLKRDHEYNYRSLEIEGVDKDGYLEICTIYEKFLGDVSDVFKNRPGEIPVIVAGFFDSFTTHPYFEGVKNEKDN